MPSKSKEELAEEYADSKDDAEWDSTSVWSAHHNGFLAGYAAGLESPEIKSLINAARDVIGAELRCYGNLELTGSNRAAVFLLNEALQAFQSKIGVGK